MMDKGNRKVKMRKEEIDETGSTKLNQMGYKSHKDNPCCSKITKL